MTRLSPFSSLPFSGPSLSGRCLTLLACAAVVALGAGCDEGTKSTETPLLEIDPVRGFVFPKLELNAEAVRRVQVKNQGRGDLLLRDIELQDDSSAGEFELFLDEDGELKPVPSLLRVPGNEVAVLAVRYQPSDDAEQTDEGVVVAESNDIDSRDVRIPVVTGGQGGEILVSPRTIDFGEVEAGQVATQPLTITNIGLVDLEIRRMHVDNEEFGARLGERDLLASLADEPLVLGEGESVVVDVTYAPPTLGPDTGGLVIESDDARQPTLTIPLQANGAAACIQVVPDSVDFGSSLQAEDLEGPPPNVRPVSVESCGTTPLKITRIEIEGGDGTFRVLDLPEPTDGVLMELPAVSEENVFPSQTLEIGFSPVELRAYGAQMLVYSNAGAEPFVVDLFGRGVDNACPIPEVVTDDYQVHPLDIITLDGTPSMDPGGQVQAWHWTVVSRPDGSVSQPLESFADPRRPADGGAEDDTATPTAQFFVDLAGRYELELRVVDNLGQESCDPQAVKRVTIEAVPDKDLHVQLVWSTPADPDETDGLGTDVDLHVRHENAQGAWNHDLWDCFFRQPNPDWGVDGDAADNPTLDIDDTNGAGPENINLSSPEVGVSYDIGAIYFRAESTFGDREIDPRTEHSSFVTVRIFVKGDLIAEFIDRELTTVMQLWHVATVTWCDDLNRCPEIEVRDEVFAEGEYQTQ